MAYTLNNVMRNNVLFCLLQMANVQALPVAKDHIPDFEVKTPVQSATRLWHKLRKGQVAATKVIPIVTRQKEDVTKFLQNPNSKLCKLFSCSKVQFVVKKTVTVHVYPCGINY